MANRIVMDTALDLNGDTVSGAKATFFESGTTTPITVYSDEAAAIPLAQPVLASAAGAFVPIFTTEDAIKAVVTDAGDVNLSEFPSDPHYVIPASGSAAQNQSFSPVTGNPATTTQEAIENNTEQWNEVTPFAKTLQNDDDPAEARETLELIRASDAEALAGTADRIPDAAQVRTNLKGVAVGPVATTSGTAIDFTALPTWVSEIELFLDGVSLSGTNDLLLQVSTGAAFLTTGYSGGSLAPSGTITRVTGFPILLGADSRLAHGSVTFRKITGLDIWTVNGGFVRGSNLGTSIFGHIELGGTLDGIRITSSGSNTFDAGDAYLTYR